jgi:hypothetical protein
MSSKTFPVIGARIMRGTLLDSCGRPAWGDRVQIASEGFVSIAVTANYDDGSEKTVTNAGGKKCVYVPAKPEFLNYSIDLTFCAVDPEFYTLATGQPVVYDPRTGDAIGYRTNRGVRPADRSWALEAWSDAQGSTICEPDDDGVPYGYVLWPFLQGARVGDYTLEDNAVTFTVSQAITKDGTGWGRGPYNVVRDLTGDPSPLIDLLDALDHDHRQFTTVAPPEETIGLVPLDDPDQPDATGATAGIPGAFTPAGAVRPFDLAALQDAEVTASPATAWTTGQYVFLGDGSRASWDGDSWAAGPAV